jgi:hypothetical protein
MVQVNFILLIHSRLNHMDGIYQREQPNTLKPNFQSNAIY